MFVVSMKASKKKLVIILAAILIVLAGALFFLLRGDSDAKAVGQTGEYSLTAADASQRVAFLQQFGWEVKETPMEQVDVLLPSSFNDTYEKYNQIQKEQGLDLLKYAGATCQRYTYEVTNYPGKDSGVVANLLVLDGRVIGGDICSVELNGFIHGFVNPNDTASLTQVSPGEGTASGAEAASPEAAASQAGEAAADPDATADASAAEGGQQTALETTSSQEPKYPVESSTERETLAPDPEMPNAPVD
jgi:hypothetical protein